jgi:hypothetical protein
LRSGQYDRIPAFEHRHHLSHVSPDAVSFENQNTVFEKLRPNQALTLSCPDADCTCAVRGTGVRPYPAPDRLSLSRLVISACTARVWSLPTSTGLRIFLPEWSRIAIA